MEENEGIPYSPSIHYFSSSPSVSILLPMQRIIKSLGYALEGLLHALKCERNLQLFILGYAVMLFFAATQTLRTWEWLALIASGTAFMAVELFNTALERLTDAVDALPKEGGNTTLHHSMKSAKDVSAAAALVGLVTVVITIVLVLGPKVL
jgi:diacylglycerol kinase